jgi:hypothetical protein
MTSQLCTFFCVVVLALSVLNSAIPERKPQALSRVDNYSYKAQQIIPRKLAAVNWDKKKEKCYLNTKNITYEYSYTYRDKVEKYETVELHG